MGTWVQMADQRLHSPSEAPGPLDSQSGTVRPAPRMNDAPLMPCLGPHITPARSMLVCMREAAPLKRRQFTEQNPCVHVMRLKFSREESQGPPILLQSHPLGSAPRGREWLGKTREPECWAPKPSALLGPCWRLAWGSCSSSVRLHCMTCTVGSAITPGS